MDDAIVSALEEGGVNGTDRAEPHGGHAAGEEHGMFLGDADVVVAFRHGLLEGLQARATRHGRGNANDRSILLADAHHGVAKDVLPVGWRARLGRGRGSGPDIIRSGAMKLLGLRLGCFEALTLLG